MKNEKRKPCQCGDCITHGPDTVETGAGTWYETVILGTNGAHIDLFVTSEAAYAYASAVAQGYGWNGAQPIRDFLEESEEIAYYDIAELRRFY